jgi:hypothetical protein
LIRGTDVVVFFCNFREVFLHVLHVEHPLGDSLEALVFNHTVVTRALSFPQLNHLARE